jgi:formylglycine-generating enzyme required for sulfatase activity
LGRFDPATNETDYPPHSVTLTRGYYIADTEVSVAQFREFALHRLSHRTDAGFVEQFQNDTSGEDPVRYVSWFEAVEFCNWLSNQQGLDPAYRKQSEDYLVEREDGRAVHYPHWQLDLDANGFRLPSEAEWGYALRNDSQTPYHFGRDEQLVPEYSVSSSRRRIELMRVRHLRPNSRGLYGMFGNVWEWSYDRFHSLDGKALLDPRGLEEYREGTFAHVFLGAGIATEGGNLDCEARGYGAPVVRYENLGFRLALNADGND